MEKEQLKNRISATLSWLQEQINENKTRINDIEYAAIGYQQINAVNDPAIQWKPYAKNQVWGGTDQHYAFRCNVVIPKNYRGKALYLQVGTGATDLWNTDNPQFLLFVDGVLRCGMDMNHHEVCLCEQAVPGKTMSLFLHGYSNSDEETNFLQMSLFGKKHSVEKLFYDMKVPFEAACLKQEESSSLETFRILNQTVSLLDTRDADSLEFEQSVEWADQFLEKEFYQKKCKTYECTVYSMGHTHIDVAWKWPVRQTREKVLRSFATVLDLMKQYPEYRFMSSQPQLYEFVREQSPELFQQIQERVKEGRWEVEGAMWLESDCNLTSGESLIRQILYGKKYIKEQFGKDSIVLWLPDVFGYSGALPQIMKKCGIRYFMTTKLGWNEYNQIPNDTMMWKGIDGSEVLVHLITTTDYKTDEKKKNYSTTYNGMQNASQIMGTWQRYQNKDISSTVLTCYGYGDGGGGPTASMLEQSRRLERCIPGVPRVKQSSSVEFFEALEEEMKGKKVPVWCGEFYLEFHRGTYTSMARNKKNNRKYEFRLSDTEFFSTLACMLGASQNYPKEQLEEAWKLLLLNQFHDILPGSAIEEVYKDSDLDYARIDAITRELIQQDLNAMVQSFGTPSEQSTLLVWNTLGFARDVRILLPEGVHSVTRNGERLKTQETQEGIWCEVRMVPAKGYVALKVEKVQNTETQQILVDQQSIGPASEPHQITKKNLEFETEYYRVMLNEAGEISSLYDKVHERNVFKAGCAGNQLIAYEDRPREYDCWNIDSYIKEKCWKVADDVQIREISDGELMKEILVTKRFMDSRLEQKIRFYHHSMQIDFETTVDWHQQQILLKADFPFDVNTTKADFEIQYGNVERNTHRNTSWDEAKFEVCSHKWVDVAEYGYGVAVLNDCKYGVSVEEADVAISLIKSGIFPNPHADQERHEFTYSILPHDGDYRQGNVIQAAYSLNVPAYVQKLEQMQVKESQYSMFQTREPNVFLDVVKRAEDSDNLVVRLYEGYGGHTKAHLKVPKQIVRVWSCDLLEKKEEEIKIEEGEIQLSMSPFEIKTLQMETVKTSEK